MRALHAASLAVLAAILPPSAWAASVADMAWLSGSWEGKVGAGLMDEQWGAPSGDSILGMARVVRGGKTTFVEFMQVKPEGAEIVLTVITPGEPEVKFRLTRAADREAVFENPGRDFPSKIVYKLTPDGALFARVEGKHDGKPISQEFSLSRK